MQNFCKGIDRIDAGVKCIMGVFAQQAADCNNCRCSRRLHRSVRSEHCREDIHCPYRIRCYGQIKSLYLCILSNSSVYFIVGDRCSCRDAAFCFICLDVRSCNTAQNVCIHSTDRDRPGFFGICTADSNILSDPGNRLCTGRDSQEASACEIR